MLFRYDCAHFIPHAQIDREVRNYAEVVLNISSDQGISRAANAVGSRQVCLEHVGGCLQESLDGIEGPGPVRFIGGIHVSINPLKTCADAEAVASFCPRQIVVNLRSRVAK